MTGDMKRNGVVYTPNWAVKPINDRTLPKELVNVSTCDPSCGDGAFLSDVVERICRQAMTVDNPDLHIKSLRKPTGLDVSSSALEDCKNNLNRMEV